MATSRRDVLKAISTLVPLRTISDSMGYASTSDLTVHFGLGETERAAVEIRCPRGMLQKLE